MRSTIAEALAGMRALHDVDAGRLRGVSLRYRYRDLPAQHSLPEPWRTRLTDAITARAAGTLSAETPEYLVFSGDLPVAWLTVHARLVRPDLPMNPTQAKHQAMAAEALSDLHRWTLADLADRRDAAEGRAEAGSPADGGDGGWVRVSPVTDPTRARWVRLSADPAGFRQGRRPETGRDVLVLDGRGYGRYGQRRRRLDLAMLRAFHTIAGKYQVSLATVGNWLDAEGATDAQPGPTPQAIIEAFAAAYLGPFGSRHAYTQHYLHEHGWSEAIRRLGIPERYLDTKALERDLFTHHVHDINPGRPGQHVEVLRRQTPPGREAPLPPPASTGANPDTAGANSGDQPVSRAGGGR